MSDQNAVFHDGLSSVNYQATITFGPELWIIEYENNDVLFQQEWHIEHIKPYEIAGNSLVFRYGDFPQQVVELENSTQLAFIRQQYPNAAFLNPRFINNQVKGWRNILPAALVLVISLVVAYFWVLPFVAGFFITKIPKQTEISLGDAMFSNYMATSDTSARKTMLINKFAGKINFHTDYPIRISVVQSEQVNAFAMPGGRIVVFTGIIDKMKNYEELAALLSHEVSHVQNKHSLRALGRNLSGYIFISLIFNDVNGLTSVLIDNANSLNNLSYSRSLEAEADHDALRILEANQINQHGLEQLFTRLDEPGNMKYLKFLSSHPLTTDRVKNVNRTASKQKKYREDPEMKRIWNEIKK